jgi:HEAT repeat protein
MKAHQRLARLHRIAEQHVTVFIQDELTQALLQDQSDVVRHEAAFIIGDLNSKVRLKDSCRALDALRHAAQDRSILVRHEVALALAKFVQGAAKECLLKLEEDRAREVADSARYALEEIADSRPLQ